jgi:hypothetical protein
MDDAHSVVVGQIQNVAKFLVFWTFADFELRTIEQDRRRATIADLFIEYEF